MIFPLKIKNKPVFFWSDLHFGHDRPFILEPRGFQSVEEAEKVTIERWNEKIPEDAVVFLLGDSCLGQNSKENLEHLFQVLNFSELYLLPGNHFAGLKQKFLETGVDDGHSFDRHFRCEIHRDGGKAVFLVPNYYEIFIGNKFFVLSHYPILSWNGISDGSIMLFGHCHSNLSKVEIGREYMKGRCFDLGLEAFPYPVGFNELVELAEQKQISNVDHH